MTHEELVQNIQRLWGEVDGLKAGGTDRIQELEARVAELEKLNQDRAALVKKRTKKSG